MEKIITISFANFWWFRRLEFKTVEEEKLKIALFSPL